MKAKEMYLDLLKVPVDSKITVKFKISLEDSKQIRGELKRVMQKSMVVKDRKDGLSKMIYYSDVINYRCKIKR